MGAIVFAVVVGLVALATGTDKERAKRAAADALGPDGKPKPKPKTEDEIRAEGRAAAVADFKEAAKREAELRKLIRRESRYAVASTPRARAAPAADDEDEEVAS